MGLFRRRQSKSWWMSFTANGKYYQKSTGTADRKLAEKILAKVSTQIVEDKWFESDLARQHTLTDLMDRYSQEVVIHKAPRTQDTNRIQITHLLSFFGNITLDKITPESISRYRSKRLSDGVKLQTVRYELIILSHAFSIAVREWQWVRFNPMKFIKLPRHTFATRLAQSGVDIYKVSKLLGHRDIKTTQRYAHHYPESLRDGVEILGLMEEKKAQYCDFMTSRTAPSDK